MTKSHHKAELVIESTTRAPAVRSAGVAVAWSRLYRANSYHIDLGFDASELRGQLLPPVEVMPTGKAALYHLSEQTTTRVSISASGSFLLPVAAPGQYRLVLQLEDTTLEIDDLDLN